MSKKILFVLWAFFSYLSNYAQNDLGNGTSIIIIDVDGDPFFECRKIPFPLYNNITRVEGSIYSQLNDSQGSNISAFMRVSIATGSNSIIPIEFINSGAPSSYLDFAPVTENGLNPSFLINFSFSSGVVIPNEIFMTHEFFIVNGDSTFLDGIVTHRYCVFEDSPGGQGENINSGSKKKRVNNLSKFYYNHFSKTIILEKKINSNFVGNLELYSPNGQLIKLLWDNYFLVEGENKYKLKLPNLSPGLYFLKFDSTKESKMIKILINN